MISNEHVYHATSGKKVLLKASGTDATKKFESFHNASVLEKIAVNYLIGEPPFTVGETSGEMIWCHLVDPMWYQNWYSPYYNDSHRAVQNQFFCHEWDEAKKLSRDAFVKAAKVLLHTTFQTSFIPMNYPVVLNPRTDPFHRLIVFDELSRCGSGGVTWALCGGLGIGLPPVVNIGSDYLKKKVVNNCLAGTKNICLCVTEPSGGSGVANLQTEAKGMGTWITNGVYADYFTVACRTGEPNFDGILFLSVERSMPGVTARQLNCSDVWPSGTAYVTFEDV
ncbi:acyl-CoA dehydrogenase/oxidase [Zychaea mexicana]|uniref:acyl-CoA dehydrogenase/oxidase n=1 Tax=Zychaea mexicana TaxID=64656 RepID=UPI0022FDF545|nr:acyl-CoA dehydrogenase/oxidase [Zychaea mexicana]KAI9498186.1 acyl-CoA dehydrogenase/oxidase [Zychaea mexicana]